MPRWLVALGIVVLVIVTLVGGGWFWYQGKVDPSGPPGDVVAVAIPEGASTTSVGKILDDQGVITSATLFNFYVNGQDLKTVQAGNYEFQQNSSFDEAIAVLNGGPGSPVARDVTKVPVPEGFSLDQVLQRISETVPRLTVEDLEAALASGEVPSALKPDDVDSYEGLLFPATYEVTDDDTAVDVLTKMTAEMDQRVEAIGIADAQAHIKSQWGLDLSPYDLINVASMIQYEAAIPEDGPKIGAVTYNRLEAGMPLQYDSTSVYEAVQQGKTAGSIDYRVDTPYNTRTRTGLPPTPIAAPGEYALEGAMLPSDGPWLYFVVTDVDEVTFTESYDDFLAAKRLCIERDLGCG